MNNKHATPDKSSTTIVVAAAFVVIWALTMYAHYRFARVELYIDEYDIAKVSRTLYRGGQMYIDEFNEKSPAIYWLLVALYKVFGERFDLLRYVSAASVSLTLLLLLAIGVRLKNPLAGLLAGAIFAFLHLFFHGYIYHAEALLTPLFLAAAFLILGKDFPAEAKIRFLLLGLVLFLATIAKQTAWIMADALLVALAWPWRKSKSPAQIIFYTLGLAAPWLVVLAYFAWRGYLPAFIAGYTYPLHSFDTTFYTYPPFSHEYYLELPVWWLSIVSFLSLFFSSLHDNDRRTLALMLPAAATIIAPAFFPYHFPPLIALGSLAFALTAFNLRPQFRFLKWIAGGGLIVLTATAIALTGPPEIKHRLLHPEHPAVAQIVQEIKRDTSPGDAIFAFTT